jgi:tripartite-type tricarboxylate transporter receptor subunit TctC
MPVQVRHSGRALRRIALAVMLFAGASPASGQTYPSRPIRIVVPLPPGSNGDLFQFAGIPRPF